MYFRSYGLQKTWLDNFLKKPILEDRSRSNMANDPKDFWNLSGSAFTIFIGHCEGNWDEKSFS